MDYKEIIKLLDAGYSRDEIINMGSAAEHGTEQTSEQQPNEEHGTDPAHEQSAAITDVMNEMKSMFSEMKKEITAMNIMNSQQKVSTKSTDDIIASIINPSKKGDK